MSAVVQIFRDERAAVLATLIRYVGDFQVAEDAVQEAFEAALATWPRDGVPQNPGAWITVTARRRAIDRLRRDRSVHERAERLATLTRLDEPDDHDMSDAGEIDDDRLRLIFTCCHPALDMPARVALTLRAVGGLTTGEIARAFLVTEPTMGKRVVRAKRKIADARIPYRVPRDELPGRVRGVLQVVYLIFNEGYSAGHGDGLVRDELCDEAIRLGRLLCELMPGEPEAWGLLSLMALHDARRAARVDGRGDYVTLPDQDRSLWDEARMQEGTHALEQAVRLGRPGPYQLQAAIAAAHMRAPDDVRTHWVRIAELYDALGRLAPSSVVEVNHATAIGFAWGPVAGLERLRPLLSDHALERYQPLHAAHAELLRRAGDVTDAARAYERAIALSGNSVERAELERRLSSLTRG
ncbi:MAG: sigma-70 family RNA polymerase sigma factor [Streptomyces sp.]|nr:sigma-70 family RNA polymerase sigma factor [Streptomyces sp.]